MLHYTCNTNCVNHKHRKINEIQLCKQRWNYFVLSSTFLSSIFCCINKLLIEELFRKILNLLYLQIHAMFCHLQSSCWTPACTTLMSETSPPSSALSPWTGASTEEAICQRSFSGWGFVCNACVSVCDDLWCLCHMYSTQMSHVLPCFPVWWIVSLPPPPCRQNLYDSIKNEPFKIPEDDGNDLTHTFFNPDREGWLLKLGMCIN